MKKNILLFVLCTSLLLAGCSASKAKQKSPLSVTINNHTYDLADDFKDVVGPAVRNGFCVINSAAPLLYDENGTIDGSRSWQYERDKDLPSFFVSQHHYRIDSPILTSAYYFCYDFDLYKCGCKTADNICLNSSAEELESLTGYVPSYVSSTQTWYTAAYIDGQLVHLGPYRKFLTEAAADGLDAFPYSAYLYHSYEFLDFNNIPLEEQVTSQEWTEDRHMRDELLLRFATAEAMYRLEQREINTFSIIQYIHHLDASETDAFFYVFTYEEASENEKEAVE